MSSSIHRPGCVEEAEFRAGDTCDVAAMRRATPLRSSVLRLEFNLMNTPVWPSPAAPNARASCNASFGELLQGALPEHGHFLVTLPIDLHAHAHFKVSDSNDQLIVIPNSAWKAQRLVEALLRRYELPLHGELQLSSDIPQGKGLSGSTADLVAAYRAVTNCYRVPQDVAILESLLQDIEPSDGVMHSGVVAYLHRKSRLHVALGPVPALTLVAIDEGGEVSTLQFNHGQPDYSNRECEEYAALLIELRQALNTRNIGAIGAVATRSAQLHQNRLPKRSLEAMHNIAVTIGAAGVVAAHSGTYLGIVIDALCSDHDQQVARAVGRIKALGLRPQLFSTVQRESSQEVAHA